MAWLRNSCSWQHLLTYLTSPCLFRLSLTPAHFLPTLPPSEQTRGGKAAVRPSTLELSFSFRDTCSRPWVKVSKIILEHWYKLRRPYLRSKLNYHGRQCLKCSGASLKWVVMNIVLSSNEQKCIFNQKIWPFHMLDCGREKWKCSRTDF